jgi:hypothetical protein
MYRRNLRYDNSKLEDGSSVLWHWTLENIAYYSLHSVSGRI